MKRKFLSHQNCRKPGIDQPNSIERGERCEPVDTNFDLLKILHDEKEVDRLLRITHGHICLGGGE